MASTTLSKNRRLALEARRLKHSNAVLMLADSVGLGCAVLDREVAMTDGAKRRC